MEKEFISGKTGDNMMGCINMTRKMVMVYINGQMKENIGANGKMINNMVMELILAIN